MAELVRLVDCHGGESGVRAFLTSCRPTAEDLVDPKYASETLGRWEAILNLTQKFGTHVWDRWLAGELEATFAEVVRVLFDQHGRFIPRNITASHKDPNRDFKLTALEGGWAKYNLALSNLMVRVVRLRQFVPSDSGLILPTAEEVRGFLAHCDGIRSRVQEDKLVANVLNGPNLPTFLPKHKIQDMGAFVELLVTIAKRSYEDEFRDSGRRIFLNYRAGDLAGKVTVVEASRFQGIISQMAESPVSGLGFFTPFQGFSVPADHEAIALLPEEFVLSAMDMIMCWALYPDILLSNWYTPGCDLAGLFWGSGSGPLCGKADGAHAYFGGRGLSARGSYSSGLFLSR